MKISKLIAICGLMLAAVATSGCLQGPVAEGGFSFFPGGINFNQGASN